MRSAQIGGDGVLRDSYGNYFGRVEAAPKPQPRLMNRNSGGMFGLGQVTTDPRLRQIVEGQFGLGAPRPVSTYKVDHRLLVTSNPDKELIIGRFVFCRAGVDPTAAVRANVDVSGVYMISSRPAAPGKLSLMKIEGDNATWVEVPEAFFRENFLAASIGAVSAINLIYPDFNPVLGGKVDAVRASSEYVRSVAYSCMEYVNDAPYVPSTLLEKGTQKENATDLGARILTSISYLEEALHSAGAGFDTNNIGFKAYFVMVSTLSSMIKSSVNFYQSVAGAIATGNPRAYEKAYEFYFKYINNVPLWAEGLQRGTLWTNLTLTSLDQTDVANIELASACSKVYSKYAANADDFSRKSGMPREASDALFRPFGIYAKNGIAGGASDEVAVNKYLSENGLKSGDYGVAHTVYSENLAANEAYIRALGATPSVNMAFDTKIFLPLSGGLGNVGNLSGGPRPLTEVHAVFKDRMKREEVNLSKLTDPAQREAVRLNAEKFGYEPFKAEILRWAKEAKEGLAGISTEILDDPVKLKDFIDRINEKAKASKNPKLESFAQKLNTGYLEKVSSRRRAAETFKTKIAKLDTLVKEHPFEAVAEVVDLFAQTKNLRIEGVGRPVAVDTIGDFYAKFYDRFRDAHEVPSVLVAQALRSHLGVEFGLKYAEQEPALIAHWENVIKTKMDIIANGKFDVAGNRVKLDAAESDVMKREVARLERLKDTFKDIEKHDATWEKLYEDLAKREKQGPDKALGNERRVVKVLEDIASIRSTYAKDYSPKKGEYSGAVNSIIDYVPFKDTAGLRLVGDALRYSQTYKETVDVFVDKLKKLDDAFARLVDALPEKRPDSDLHVNRFLEDYEVKISQYVAAHRELENAMRVAGARKTIYVVHEARWRIAISSPLALVELGKYVRNKAVGKSRILALVSILIVEAPLLIVNATLLAWGVYYSSIIVAWIPAVNQARNLLGDGLDLIWNFAGRIFPNTDTGRGRGGKTGQSFDPPTGKEPLGIWEIVGLGALGAVIIAPHKVIPAALRLVNTVIGGVSSIVGGGKGRGRPPGGGKKAVGAGAPPDINRAIDDIKKGQAQGNPFLVKKGIEKLKRAKQMGLPVPKGYIDGLGWKR